MFRNLALWLIIGVVLFMVFNQFSSSDNATSVIPYSEFISRVEDGYITSATIKGSKISGETESGQAFETYAPTDLEMLSILRKHNIKVTAEPDTNMFYMISPIIYFVLLIAFLIFIMRQMNGGGGGGRIFSFGKSKARMLVPDEHKVTFKDVAGVDEAKEELEEVVEFLKDSQKFQKLGGKIPKGVLLVGSPGTGKTLLAKAVAGEAGVAFFSISGSDFVEMFVGVGAARIRDLFEQGKKNAPCIIFMDEIDAVGRHRGAGLGGGHDEREQTLNALLVEMDGFESTQGVILIAATNRPDVLDPALLRPGRFDRQVVVPLPDVKGRRLILGVHVAKVPLADGVNLDLLAKRTSGFSGASLANLVNEAALLAARKNHEKVDMSDLDEAIDKVSMGKERRSAVIPDKVKEGTAYHEAGHAIVAQVLKDADVVHKVTIIPRGNAGGMTMLVEAEEKHMMSKEACLSLITVGMGGRAAESIIYNRFTTGASSDIERSTSMARHMVTAWGMSEAVGPVLYGRREGSIFLGKEISSAKDYSEKTAEIIDAEVRNIIESCYQKAVEILKDNRILMEKMKDALLEKETIGTDEIDALIDEFISDKWRQAAQDKVAELAEIEARSDKVLNDMAESALFDEKKAEEAEKTEANNDLEKK